MKALRIVILVLTFCACRTEHADQNNKNKGPESDSISAAQSATKQATAPPKNKFTVRLEPISIVLAGLNLYEDPSLAENTGDTVKYFPDLDFDPDSLEIIPDLEDIHDFIIEEQYQTTVSVMNEGPHLELYDWKSYQSEWVPLQKKAAGIYMVNLISKKESEMFPEFTREELTEAVHDAGGKEWSDLIKNPYGGDWKQQFWIGVGIRKLRLKGIKDNLPFSKYIFIYPPMGC
jgi:hypothetical protein